MDGRIRLRARAHQYRDAVEIYAMTGSRQDGSMSHGVSIQFVQTEPGMYYDATARIDMTAAQELMDDLWASGLRPTEGSGSAGSMRATENHLADMRKIAFRALKLDGTP